jgi:hypothetical protein
LRENGSGRDGRQENGRREAPAAGDLLCARQAVGFEHVISGTQWAVDRGCNSRPAPNDSGGFGLGSIRICHGARLRFRLAVAIKKAEASANFALQLDHPGQFRLSLLAKTIPVLRAIPASGSYFP